MKTPISYYGGKQTLLKHILPLIPNHKLYTEAFCVQSLLNLLFQVTIIDFSHPIKVRYIHADIVYNFAVAFVCYVSEMSQR